MHHEDHESTETMNLLLDHESATKADVSNEDHWIYRDNESTAETMNLVRPWVYR